jgi:hypothetical protein
LRFDGRWPALSESRLDLSTGAGLDQPAVWSHFVDWNLILEMGQAFRPREQSIREILGAS